jgi:hypothetical protein
MRPVLPASALALLAAVFFRCDPVEVGNGETAEKDTTSYACGKIRCGEMKTCKEAIFHLKNCPGVEVDGDGDGIPCEEQLCGH